MSTMAGKLAPRVHGAHAVPIIFALEDHNIRNGYAERDASKNECKVAYSARVGQIARDQPAELVIELGFGDGAMECCRQVIREQDEG